MLRPSKLWPETAFVVDVNGVGFTLGVATPLCVLLLPCSSDSLRSAGDSSPRALSGSMMFVSGHRRRRRRAAMHPRRRRAPPLQPQLPVRRTPISIGGSNPFSSPFIDSGSASAKAVEPSVAEDDIRPSLSPPRRASRDRFERPSCGDPQGKRGEGTVVDAPWLKMQMPESMSPMTMFSPAPRTAQLVPQAAVIGQPEELRRRRRVDRDELVLRHVPGSSHTA